MSSKGADGSAYKGHAGGWAALRSSLKQLKEQGAIVRGTRALFRTNQAPGFDCPGCAWPEPKNRSSFEFCENGAKAVAAETTSRRVTPEFFARHTVSELIERPDRWLEAQGRLTHPMAYDASEDRYKAVSWSEAFAEIGETLRGLDSPNEALFYTSGRTSNEAAFLYQLFARAYGTNNLPDCSNLCHESSGAALGRTIGIGKGTVTLEDFEAADLIFVMGQNPGTNHPRMLTTLQEAAQRGATIVSVNPLKERGLESFVHPQDVGAMITGRATPISTHYLQPLVGGDLALVKGLMKVLVEGEDADPGTVLDHDFLAEHTTGSEAVLSDVRETPWEDIVRESGLEEKILREIGELYARSERVIVCWAMGLTQHRHAVPTLETIVSWMLLRGNVGREGAGFCPVRGHSNVQGDRTMGIVERPSTAFLDALDQEFSMRAPRAHGVDAVDAIHAMAQGRARVFFGMGGNFAAATPDTNATAKALRSCALTVHVSTKLNRSHLVHGERALILPCLGRSEVDLQASGPQRVTVEDSMSVVHASQGTLKPASEHLLSEPAIVAGVAEATLGLSTIAWSDLVTHYDKIRDVISRVIPGFEDYNQRIEAPEGFYLGNSAAERRWKTQSGRAELTAHPIPDLGLAPGLLRLMTLRSHDQYNTTIYSDDDRYRGIRGERRVILCHPEDLAERSITPGDMVNLVSVYEDGERRCEAFRTVAYAIPRGCAAGYFPEMNPLVSLRSVATTSGTPTSKWIPVRLEPT
jgi:molybdopterin-dependent oxidoreductase alpha subunit